MNQTAILRQLFASYPTIDAPPETIAMYLRLLGDIPEDELQAVVDQAVSTSEFLPTIAKLRDIHYRLQRINTIGYSEAWENVQKEMRRIGSYGKPEFADELTARVVKTMGWRLLCASESPSIDRAQFRDMYNDLAQRAEFSGKLTPQAQALAARNGTKLLEVAP